MEGSSSALSFELGRLKVFPLSVGLGLVLIGSGLTIYYLLYKEDDVNLDNLPRQNITKKRRTFLEVKIEKEKVGHLIGKSGANIKEIQDKTLTRITFKDEVATEPFRVCVIRGLPGNVQRGEYMVLEFLAKNVIKKEEITIPPDCCGLIIGKNGTTIRALQLDSGAKISIDSSECGVKGHSVTLKGTEEEIKKAKELINKKIENDGIMRNKPIDIPAYKRPAKFDPSVHAEYLTYTDEFVEVFVSSLKDPSSFYLQIAGENRDQLNVLSKEMSEFYEAKENLTCCNLEDLVAGSIVACCFMGREWCRASVIKVKSSSQIKVFYLDYGDIEVKNIEDIFALPPEFKELKHQAIHCCLSGIEKDGPTWAVEAIDYFEELTYELEDDVNKKSLLAKVDSYVDRPRHGLIPSVILKDSSGIDDKIIAEEMLARGFGKAVQAFLPNMMPAGEEEDWNLDA